MFLEEHYRKIEALLEGDCDLVSHHLFEKGFLLFELESIPKLVEFVRLQSTMTADLHLVRSPYCHPSLTREHPPGIQREVFHSYCVD